MGKFGVGVCAFACYFEAASRSIDKSPWYQPLAFMAAAGVFSAVLWFMERAEDKK